MTQSAESTTVSPSVPDRLLAEATRLFAQRGFDRVSVQELVEAAGVTKGAMYHYFTSKDDLLFAIYQRVLQLQMSRLAQIVERGGDVTERLHAAAADVVKTTVDNLDDMVIFFRSLHMLSPDRQREVRKERRAYHELFRSLVEEGMREGVFQDNIPADIVVNYFFGSIHHLSMWYRADGELDGAQLGEYYADLLLASLRAD